MHRLALTKLLICFLVIIFQLYSEATLVFPLIVAETFAQRVSLPHKVPSKDDDSDEQRQEIIK